MNLKFDKYKLRNRIPFVIYADFESINKNILDDRKTSKTIKLSIQEAAAVGFYILSDYQDLIQNEYIGKRSENIVEYFCDWLIENEAKFASVLNSEKKMIITKEEEIIFQNTKECYYCDKDLNDDRVRDHDHYNGKYRGASHNSCNLNANKPNFVPIFFHNLSHYDAHLFIKQLLAKLEKKQMSRFKLLAKNTEDYISFQFGCFRFLDSLRFLQGSLDKCTKSMSDEDFKITSQFYPNKEDFKLLRKKGSVPYSFYTSHESFNETTLTKEMFYDTLKDQMEPVSVFEKAKENWQHFKCKNHGEFIDIYLKSDVLLLADLFEKFREVNMKYFEIDPCHCYSAPGLTWQAGFKYTKANLELLTDIDTLLSFEKAIRGGVSGIMGTRYVKSDSDNKLLYVDANNLYGWAMMQNQPYGDFKLSDNPEQGLSNPTKEEILGIPENSPIGYFFEVDLEYPESIKFKSKNLPYCPESLFIEYKDLSEYQKKVLGDEKRSKVEKLILTQNNKNNYIVHYRLLQFYLERGMVLKKIHKIISFKQKKWLEPYIDFNTKRRMESKTDFEKDYFKLMNNAFYGKTCENIRKRKDIRIVNDAEEALNLHTNPKFDGETIFNNEVSAILMRKTSMHFDKPIYIGATVLELSKLLMYKFYYETLQPYFGEKHIELLYMDTDSFVLKIKTNNLTEDLNQLKDHFDFSNYPKDHQLYDKSKMKVPGYFKDELAGDEMLEFISLKSKMYAYRTKNGEAKKLKGISSNVVRRDISFDDYYDALENNKTFSHKMRTLRSKKHEMYIEEINKKSLNPFDDKRYILDDGITTLPFGGINIEINE